MNEYTIKIRETETGLAVDGIVGVIFIPSKEVLFKISG